MARKYAAIQMLRFVAATFVVIDHAIVSLARNWAGSSRLEQFAWSLGEVGVIVFFGISGFIMTTTQYESFGNADKSAKFILHRMIRIMPIYVIATTAEYLHRMRLGNVYSFSNYMKSILFIPYIGADGLFRPILGQGWTLNYEMFFYFVFAISLFLSRPAGLMLSIVGFVLLACLQDIVSVKNVLAKFYLNHILLYFVCGMLVGILRKNYQRSTERLLLPMLFVLSIMVVVALANIHLHEISFLVVGILGVFACVHICASCLRNRDGALQAAAERLGDASYCTYLFHGFCMGAIQILVPRIGNGQYVVAAVYVVFCAATANLCGLFSHKFLEQPISRYLNKCASILNRAPASG